MQVRGWGIWHGIGWKHTPYMRGPNSRNCRYVSQIIYIKYQNLEFYKTYLVWYSLNAIETLYYTFFSKGLRVESIIMKAIR